MEWLRMVSNLKNKKIKSISGISILEALVSTVIVGIGFIAILQMVNYSVQSIHTSGERTKANFFTNMIAEDVIGHKEATSGATAKNFSDFLHGTGDAGFQASACSPAGRPDNATNPNVGNVYGTDVVDAPLLKLRKWETVLNSGDYLRCTGDNEVRNFKVYKLSRSRTWTTETEGTILINSNIFDDVMYIGRIQMNLNDGKKRKYLYFQTDYRLKQ
ncbi:MAG: pilus assembly protein PilV [Candidatus Pelagibacter sp.]|jgi:hypothetical protein